MSLLLTKPVGLWGLGSLDYLPFLVEQQIVSGLMLAGCWLLTYLVIASSFFSTLAAQGLLEYPLFAFSLTRNSTGALTIGAIDSSIVSNVSQISWNKVAQFPPFGAENNISSYLQWAIPIMGVAVSTLRVIHTQRLNDIAMEGQRYTDYAQTYLRQCWPEPVTCVI